MANTLYQARFGDSRGILSHVSHRAAVYTIRVRRKRDKPEDSLPLGDIDYAGTSLLEALDEYILTGFEARSEEGNRVVQFSSSKVEGEELHLMFEHGEEGVAGDIRKAGVFRFRRETDDTEFLRCGCLLRLPPNSQIGWAALHINNNVGIKGLLEKELKARFRKTFPRLILDITPFVLGSVLHEAVQQNRVEKVKLVKFEQPNDRSIADTGKWVRAGVAARVELSIAARGALQHVAPDLLLQFLRPSPIANDTRGAFDQIIEFQNMRFDQAKVEVALPTGYHRTFNIERPDAGHPITQDLDLEIGTDGEPTEESLFRALRDALSTVGT